MATLEACGEVSAFELYVKELRAMTKSTYAQRASWKHTLYGDAEATPEQKAQARNALWQSLLWLSLARARRAEDKYGRGLFADLEDRIQAGNMAILTALDSWNPKKAAHLLTWVQWAIDREQARENRSAQPVIVPEGAASDDTLFWFFSYDTDLSPDEQVEGAAGELERTDALNRVLVKLEPAKRAVIELVFFSHMTHAEAAEALEIDQSTLTRRVNVALLELKNLMISA